MAISTIAIIVLVVVIVFLLWVIGDREKKWQEEVEYRDRHLAWVDRRDVLLTELFTKVSEARVVPMTNPLDGMKQFGMLTKNAMNNAGTYLAEMDERLTYAQGFLKRSIAVAKEIERWEARNPAPPVRPGEERNADVSQPMPVGVPAHDQFVDDRGDHLPATFAKPQALGKGAFGPEQEDEEEYDPEADVDPTHMEDHYNGDGYSDDNPTVPRRRVRDNPQA